MMEITTAHALDCTSGNRHPIRTHRVAPRIGGLPDIDAGFAPKVSTTECPRCSITFLRYASECPECGLVVRRKKRNTARARAFLYSAMAIAMTCLFITQFKATEGATRVNPAQAAPIVAPQAQAKDDPHKPAQIRYIIVREADLKRMPVGPRISSVGPRINSK